MNRRHAIRQASLLAFGVVSQKLDVFKAQGGQFIVDLGDWDHVVFKLGKRIIKVPVAEVFRALEEGI